DVARWSRVLLLAGTLTPILSVTVLVAIVGFYGREPAGPAANTVFAWLGWTVNVVTPLAILGFILTGHGVREKAAGYVFGAGIILLAAVTGGYALAVVTGGGILDAPEVVFLGQLGAVTAATWALWWLGSGGWRNRLLLGLQMSLALAVN